MFKIKNPVKDQNETKYNLRVLRGLGPYFNIRFSKRKGYWGTSRASKVFGFRVILKKNV